VVNVKKIQGLLDNLKTYVGYLRNIAQTERAAFLSDPAKIGGAKYYLQTAIAACIDLGNHIIAAEHYRPPKDYRDIFTVLNETGVLPSEFTVTLRRMAGLRNRLVHLYWEVDDAQIYDDLQNHLGDFDTYVQHILAFLQRQPPGLTEQ
jgi:uncharacterized protein YutE (UPF0331/DUF86 family)